MHKAIIDQATGNVVIVLADGAEWRPPEEQMIGAEGGEIDRSGMVWLMNRRIPSLRAR